MKRLHDLLSRDRRGAVALMYGLALVPLLLGVGSGVDIARGLQVKQVLQGAVDAAALAGASAYANGDSSGAASTVASNYFSLNGLPLPDQAPTPTPTVSTSVQTTNGAVSGYTVTVTATTQMPTTFMNLLISSVPVTVSATAVNPVSTVTLDGSGILDNFKSSACDLNSIYYYLTSDNNTIPNPSTFSSSQMVGTNGTTNNPQVSFQISATQKIGFALKNVTGGICNYGNTQYGSGTGPNQLVLHHCVATLEQSVQHGPIPGGDHEQQLLHHDHEHAEYRSHPTRRRWGLQHATDLSDGDLPECRQPVCQLLLERHGRPP